MGLFLAVGAAHWCRGFQVRASAAVHWCRGFHAGLYWALWWDYRLCLSAVGETCVAFAGVVAPDATACNAHGIDAFFPILRRISTLQEAMDTVNARQNMTDTVEQALRLFLLK